MENKTNIDNTEGSELGDYSGETTVLSQEQMLGIGGGVIFYEIQDKDGLAREHLAMPVLFRDRAAVKAALRKHGIANMKLREILIKSSQKDLKEFTGSLELDVVEAAAPAPDVDEDELSEDEKQIQKYEEIDADALLTLAYLCFKRVDPTVRGKSMEDGKKAIAEWIDEKQLQTFPTVAMGLNKFIPPR